LHQFVLGGDLQSCRKALISLDDSSLHIIERVSIDLQVQNSIVPSVVSLARFKISGKLPTLQLNFSDFKYKSILRLIDVTIPRFDKPVADSKAVAPPDYDLSSGFFDLPQTEYNIDETDTEDAEDEQPANDKSREVRIPSSYF
jgi:vacuolar protein sorting-associated protein 13A/C